MNSQQPPKKEPQKKTEEREDKALSRKTAAATGALISIFSLLAYKASGVGHGVRTGLEKVVRVRRRFIFLITVLTVCLLLTSFLLATRLERYFFKNTDDLNIDLIGDASFTADDGNGNAIFSQESQARLFYADYANGEGEITVCSQKGDDVIAPGTSGRYVFRLQNSGDTTLYYSLAINGELTNAQYFPIVVRLKAADGTYLIGDSDTWEPITELRDIADSGSLDVHDYQKYVVEWMWPFEGGNDAGDTALGDGVLNVGLSEFNLSVQTMSVQPTENTSSFTYAMNRAFPWILAGILALLALGITVLVKYRRAEKELH